MDFKNFQIKFLESLNSEETTQELDAEIQAIGKLSVSDVLKIYRQDYVFRLTEALGEFYESIWFVLGDETFLKVAQEYIKTHPSTVLDLSLYGRDFPAYLKNTIHFQEFPFLYELANLELAYWDFFHSKVIPFDDPWDSINQENLADLKLVFPKGTSILSSEYSLASIFMARKNKLEEDFEWDKAEYALMYKSYDQVGLIKLSEHQKLIIEKLLEGKSISDALNIDVEIGPDEVSKIFMLLRTHQVQVEFKI